MNCKHILVGILLAIAGITQASADAHGEAPPAQQEEKGGVLDAVRTVVYLPFKGVLCGVGSLLGFPVYVLSGLDSEVKADTTTLRTEHCSQHYLLSPEWTK